MGSFDDLVPKPAGPQQPAAPALSAPGSPFADLMPNNRPGMAETAARSAVQGLTFGLADESYGLTQGIKGMVTGEGFSAGYDRGVKEFRGKEKAGREANPVTATAAEIAGGMGTGLGAMRAGATLMRGGMGLGQMAAAGAGEGAIYGAISGAGNAEGGLDARLKGAQEGAVVGTAVGGAVPLVARGVGTAIGKAVTPISASPERQAMVDTLRREGVPVTAGQATGSKALQFAEATLGDAPFAGGKATRAMEAQGEAFTDAAMRRVGGAGRATPENLQSNFDRLKQQFTDLSSRNTMQADRQLVGDITGVMARHDLLLEPQKKKIVGDLAADLVGRIKAGGGTLPGDEYQAIRSTLSGDSQKQSNQYIASAMKGLRDALDNNMMRSISPEDASAWQAARREYENLKDIAKAAGGAGENAAGGLISPQALRGATASGKKREAYARGQGDFAELTRAGNAIMTPLPNSGTAQRTMAASPVGGGAFLAGGGDPIFAAIIALGPAAAGRVLMSPMAQAYFGNTKLSPATRAAIEQRLRAVIQGGAQTQSERLLPER